MSNQQVVSIDNLRTVAYTGISATYAVVGTKFTQAVRLIVFTNATDVDVLFSDDGVNDKLFVASGSFKLFDITTNRFSNQQQWAFGAGTQFYVRTTGAPTSKAVYIECLWGQ